MKNEAFEEKCMDVIEAVVSMNSRMNRYGAIKFSKVLLLKAKIGGNVEVIKIFERVHKEFEIASDEDYELLRKQIFE